jgi:hypothetical protein
MKVIFRILLIFNDLFWVFKQNSFSLRINLTERLWKFIRKKLIRHQFYRKLDDFKKPFFISLKKLKILMQNRKPKSLVIFIFVKIKQLINGITSKAKTPFEIKFEGCF